MNEKNKINVGFEAEKKKRKKTEIQLIVEVLGKKKDWSTSGEFAGKVYYRLRVKVEKPDDLKWLEEIKVFDDKLDDKEIWQEVETDDYFDKRKLAICGKYQNSFHLIRWTDRPLGGGVK